jgi:hypothetical protein
MAVLAQNATKSYWGMEVKILFSQTKFSVEEDTSGGHVRVS